MDETARRERKVETSSLCITESDLSGRVGGSASLPLTRVHVENPPSSDPSHLKAIHHEMDELKDGVTNVLYVGHAGFFVERPRL
jgi:hypothetical protein